MSTELAILDANQMQAAVDYAERLAYSGLIPDVYQGKPANVLWAIEFGRTLGLSTLAAINGVNVIKGKPTASAALISALVRRAGHKMRIGYNAATMTGWAEIVRVDDPDFTFRSEWDLERAVEAELCKIKDGKPYAVDSKGNTLPWKKFYPSMVKARATTEVARDACEEVLFGLHYTPEELGAVVDDDGSVITVRQEPAYTPQDAADALARKAEREMVDIAPRQQQGQRNPFDPDFDLPPTLGTASASKATNAQLGKIAILVGEKRGVSGKSEEARTARLAILSAMVGHELTTGSDMTLREAQEVIDSLELEPNHVADLEIVEDTPPLPESQLHADLTLAIQEVETEVELTAVLTSVEGAVAGGELTPDQGNGLLASATAKRRGWSHRVMQEQLGVSA